MRIFYPESAKDFTPEVHMKSSQTRQTVDRALELLCCFTAKQQEWSVGQLSSVTGLEKSIVSRLLNTLQQHGFLYQDPRTRSYTLGGKILELADAMRPETVLSASAGSLLVRLAYETGETAVLGLRRGWTCLCAQIVESNKSLRCGPRVGQQYPLHAGAIGKAILAYLPPAELAEYLKRDLESFTPNTITDPQRLLEHLAEIRQKGYATSFGEMEEGIAALGVPVTDYQDNVIATISVDMPAIRFTSAEDCVGAMKKAAAELTAMLKSR